ncbi:MAG: ABC transporter ATP-binding protein [Defluviitaleaceae bacterium]|nr:ABC transporter ATP-binding protein [Defluviitaleaceae bacterium]
MLCVNNITKQYGNFIAIDNIALEFSQGIYGLLAPNGAGKTTLIKLLATLIFPTKGKIMWNNAEITKLDKSYRDIIGYLPQDFGYYKSYTAHGFLYYIAILKGIDKKTALNRIERLLEIVGLSDEKYKPMGKLSGGMVQRIGIAQAMLNNPKILILDEPTAGLDPKERVRFRNLVSSLSKDRIVIISTHIVSDIETIANTIIMLKDRKIVANAAPGRICNVLAGKIYETDNISAIKAPYLHLTERQDNGKTLTRFVCEADCRAYAYIAAPNLEDVFLYIYRDDAV